MALFEVPGWDMPKGIQPTTEGNSRKRKRPTEETSSSRLQTAEVNVERLMEKLTKDNGRPGGKKKKQNSKASEKKRPDKERRNAERNGLSDGRGHGSPVRSKNERSKIGRAHV